MKKITLILISLLLSVTIASAQDAFERGDKVINVGIGLGATLHTGSGYSTKVPPISGSFEICVVDNLFDNKSSIGVGGLIGYASYKYKNSILGANFKHTYSDFVIAARGALHYQFVRKLDTYVGLSLGYDIVSAKTEGYKANSSSGFHFGGYLGARYYFSDHFAVMGELGYDIAIFNIGVAYKF